MRMTALTIACALAPAVAQADACGTVTAALEKLAAAPAAHQTISMGDRPPMQMIALGDAMYVDQGEGGWMKLPLKPGMRASMMQEAIPDATALKECGTAGSDVIDGLAMTIYRYLPPSFAGETPQPQQLWIGDADGLPYRMTTTSEGKPMEMTVRYQGVTAPLP